MKDNKTQLKKVLISKYSLGKDLVISSRDYDKNADPERAVIGYEVLNGDYKGSFFVEQGYPPYYTFIAKKPVKYQRGNSTVIGDIDITEDWFDKVCGGDVRVKAFDTIISYRYMAEAVNQYVLSIADNDIIVDKVPSFRDFIENRAKNFPSAAITNSGRINGFIPFATAVAKLAKENISVELATRGYKMDTERIDNYIAKVKEEVKNAVLEARNESADSLE